MNWIQKLERKFGRYAINNLMLYITIFYIVGYALNMLSPGFYSTYLSLDVSAILRGQVWRLVTFIIEPLPISLIFLVFALHLYYMIGQNLEAQWGAFRFNLYFFSGVLFHIIAAFIVYFVTGYSLAIGTGYLNLSLFFAFAMLYPNVEFLVFFIIPVKVKYLAILDAVFFGYTILQAFMPAYGGSPFGIYYHANAIAAAVSIMNFVVFYLSSRNFKAYSPKQVRRKKQFQRDVRNAHVNKAAAAAGARHKCAVCGRTELDDPNLEFRYCSKCNGVYEYCSDHLFTHEHIK